MKELFFGGVKIRAHHGQCPRRDQIVFGDCLCSTWLTRPPKWVPRCGRGDCRFAFRHLGRCAMTPLGRACFEAERRISAELDWALHRDRPRLGFNEMRIMGLDGVLTRRVF